MSAAPKRSLCYAFECRTRTAMVCPGCDRNACSKDSRDGKCLDNINAKADEVMASDEWKEMVAVMAE